MELAVVRRVMDALESDATKEQRREAWNALRDRFWPVDGEARPQEEARSKKLDFMPHVAAAGGCEGAIRNILTHFRVLLTPDEVEAINWHERQSVDTAVMRIISEGQDAKAASLGDGVARQENP
jgi:hypothetical protein